MSDPIAVQAIDVTIGWGDTILQEHATFDVPRGSIFAILGGSGCGKSTLLRHLIGLEEPIAGTINVDGCTPVQGPSQPPRFGVMFQSGALLGSLSVAENVALPLQQWTRLPPDAVGGLVAAKLRLVGLSGAAEQMPAELSGGMRKRVAIARAMALEPELIFLDEPSAGLDPVSSAGLDELILDLNLQLGLTFVIVTHELESIFKVAQSCIMLDRATRSIIARGDPRVLRDTSKDPRVLGFFNRIPGVATA
ncbi:MAG TPA: ATP-binding cassette domain-containing protein [Myxococcales bacterium]|jgi:phospholipid/cholesterol/gamma-HCH transport system ATP-binding protein|nr:ATP-binding cassette domain-containing protein [Myxococcales bacterium]